MRISPGRFLPFLIVTSLVIFTGILLFYGAVTEIVVSGSAFILFLLLWYFKRNQTKVQLKKEAGNDLLHNMSLVEFIADAVITTDENFNITGWNKSAEEIYGYSVPEALDKNIVTLLDINIDPLLRDKQFEDLLKKGFYKAEYELRRKNGERFPVLASVSVIRNKAGKIKRYIAVHKDITERRQAQDKLKKFNEELVQKIEEATRETKDILERVSDGFIALDTQYRYVYSNKKAGEILGYEPGYLTGKIIWEVFPAAVGTSFYNAICTAIDEQKYVHLEDYYTSNDRWFETHIYPSPEGVSVYFRDITKKKKAEQQIKKTEEIYAVLVNTIDGIVWEADAKTFQFSFVSKKAEQLLGYPAEQWIEEPDFWANHIYPEDREYAVNYCIECTCRKKSHEFEYRMLAKDGSVIWLRDIVTVITENDEPVLLRGIMVDITERKKAEAEIKAKTEALTTALQELNEIIEHTAETIFKLDLQGNLTYVSPEFYRILRFSPGQMLGKNLTEIVYPEDVPLCLAAFIDCVQTGATQRQLIYRVKDVNGNIRWTNTSATLVKNAEGIPQYVLGISQDVTELKTATASLEAAEERYRMFIRQSSEGIWRLEIPGGISTDVPEENIISYTIEHGYFAECNDVYARTYGYEKAEDMIGFKLGDVMPVNDEANLQYFLHFIRSGFRLSDGESTETDKYGNKKIILNKLTGIIENGKLVRVWGTQQDITEKKKAELALQGSEERYRAFIKQSSEAIWRGEITPPVNITDPVEEQIRQLFENGYLAECNDQMAKLYGLKEAGQLTGKKLKDFVPITADLTLALSAFFVQNGYRIDKGPSIQLDSNGNKKYFLNNLVGIVENGFVVRVWGTQTDVTKQRIAEKALQASEERYKTFIHNISEGICRVELKIHPPVNIDDDAFISHMKKHAYIAECNDAFAKMYGLENAAELAGQPFSIWFEHNEGNAPANYLLKLKHSGYRLSNFETEEQDAKGNRKIFLNNLFGIIINNKLHRFWVVQRDITQLRMAESKIWHLANLVDNTSDVVISQNLSLEIISWNKAAEKIYEVPASHAIGKVFKDIVTLQYINCSREDVLKHVETYGNWSGEVAHNNSSGKKIYLSVTAKKLYDSAGRHSGYFSVAREITDILQARQKLEASEQFYKSLSSDSVDGMVLLDENGVITYMAPSVTNVLGYTEKEMLGIRADEFIYPEDREYGIKIFMEELNKDFASVNHEMRYLSKENKAIWVMMRPHNMLNNPYVKAMAIYFNDITERKNTEEELRQSREKLKVSLEEIRRLTEHLQNIREAERTHIAREIHDELGQQLTVLKMDISLLGKKIQTTDETVLEKFNSLQELLDGTVKTVRRISSELRPSVLDDLGLIAAIEWHTRDFEKRTGIAAFFNSTEFDIQLSKQVATGVYRIFQEALTNAARHSSAGKINIYLTIALGNLVLEICDDGKGFDKMEIEHKKTLGLIGIKERTHMMGGECIIDSSPGTGTRIKAVVPLFND
jgi:PAS domain S-box-containing protein